MIYNALQTKAFSWAISKMTFFVFTEKLCNIDDTFKFWHDFIHRDCFSYISLYLSFRSSDWELRIAALKRLAPLFHAYDRHMYLRTIPKHLFDVLSMPETVITQLKAGGFSATITGKNWQQLALDEAHESYINLDVKQSVKRPSPELLDSMAVFLPYRASLQNNLNIQLGNNNTGSSSGQSNNKFHNEISSCYLKKTDRKQCFQE